MLYTIVDHDIIWQNYNEQELLEKTVIEYNGVKLEVALLDPKTYIVNKIISTSPKDYLKPEFQPGSKIELVPKTQD